MDNSSQLTVKFGQNLKIYLIYAIIFSLILTVIISTRSNLPCAPVGGIAALCFLRSGWFFVSGHEAAAAVWCGIKGVIMILATTPSENHKIPHTPFIRTSATKPGTGGIFQSKTKRLL
ncbi:hypothetical protein NQD34_014827 [Periophthalmus magnuspinnatus]|nr:hypothetical protein NQD34_014827 [Periophthalmus magnuspinnatus]